MEVSGGGIAVTEARVGQTVKISAVDDSGIPTAWEAVDFPSGGGTSFKTFTLTLGEGATLKVTDMGSNLVHVNFVFNGEHDPSEPFQYMLPTGYAEFNDFMRGKHCIFATNPFITLYGTNGRQGSYANDGFMCMFGGENTDLPNTFMLIADSSSKYNDEKLNAMIIDATVTMQG